MTGTNKFSIDARLVLLTLFAFTLPNSVALNNILKGLIFLYWLFFHKNKKEFFKIIFYNPAAFFGVLFFFSLALSVLWSSDLKWSAVVLGKESLFLFIPIFMQLIKKRERHLLIKTFIFAMTLDEIISYSVHLGLIKPVFGATPFDPSPFMGHISYDPFLAFTIYLLIYYFVTTKENLLERVVSAFFIVSMSINLFITGGRAGQVAFFVMLFIVFFQFVGFNLKKLVVFTAVVVGIFLSAYSFSSIFHERVNLAVRNVANFKKNPNTSVGLRIVFAKNTLKIIKKEPLLGVGVGDFPKVFKNYMKKYSPKASYIPKQPHDMYLFAWASAGLLALFSLLGLLFSELFLGFSSNDELRYPRIAFPILFLVISFSDSYLLGHFTTNLFVFFSSLFYQGFTWRDLKKFW